MKLDSRVPAPRSAARLAAVALLLAASGCEPTQEDPLAAGGLAPPPRATLRGSLTYSGPRPTCTEDGQIKGLALLLLYARAAPPPPQGSGLPASLLLIPGDQLFRAEVDCRSAAPEAPITRSVGFTWPGVPLDPPIGSGSAAYQVLGTWDDDRNLNPLYLVRSSPTLGDVLGGAFEGSLDDPSPALVQVGPSADFPDGQVLDGVTVTLAAPVSTEVPVARLGAETEALSSEATVPIAFDRASVERLLLDQTTVGVELPELSAPPYAAALETAGLSLSSDPLRRAWYVKSLDLDDNGAPDPHPILGAIAGVPRLSPVVAFTRARTVAEQAAGVPDVVLLPHPVAAREVVTGALDLAVPPIAVVQLDPLDPTCAVPYAAPGNVTLVYEGAGAVCSELPTGVYDVNVVHGLAGATPTESSTVTSATGLDLVGGQPSGQFWIIPNELGQPDTRYNPLAQNQLDAPEATSSLTIDEQGAAGRFAVVDPDPTDDLPSARPACASAVDPLTGSARPIQFRAVPAPCCARIAHLCGLPLCPTRTIEGRGAVREIEALDAEGKAACVPFEMPPSCCD